MTYSTAIKLGEVLRQRGLVLDMEKVGVDGIDWLQPDLTISNDHEDIEVTTKTLIEQGYAVEVAQ